jgi:hypothetical protein
MFFESFTDMFSGFAAKSVSFKVKEAKFLTLIYGFDEVLN